jgi:hypothetical protein
VAAARRRGKQDKDACKLHLVLTYVQVRSLQRVGGAPCSIHASQQLNSTGTVDAADLHANRLHQLLLRMHRRLKNVTCSWHTHCVWGWAH